MLGLAEQGLAALITTESQAWHMQAIFDESMFFTPTKESDRELVIRSTKALIADMRAHFPHKLKQCGKWQARLDGAMSTDLHPQTYSSGRMQHFENQRYRDMILVSNMRLLISELKRFGSREYQLH